VQVVCDLDFVQLSDFACHVLLNYEIPPNAESEVIANPKTNTISLELHLPNFILCVKACYTL